MLNTPRLMILLLLGINLSLSYSSINMAINGPSSSKEKEQENEADKIDQIRSWLNQTISEPLPSFCFGQDEEMIPDKDLLIRHVPCHQKGALKRYFAKIQSYLKRSEGGRRPTLRSVFKFFFESWLFYRQDFGFKAN